MILREFFLFEEKIHAPIFPLLAELKSTLSLFSQTQLEDGGDKEEKEEDDTITTKKNRQ